MMPMFPNVIPNRGQGRQAAARRWWRSTITCRPPSTPRRTVSSGCVEVLGTPDGSLYYRVFGRGEKEEPRRGPRGQGPLTKGKEITAFGGNPNMPMTISFAVEEYLTSGVEKEVCEPIVLPKGQMGNGIAASLVEMTVTVDGRGRRRSSVIRRSPTLDPALADASRSRRRRTRSRTTSTASRSASTLKLDDFERRVRPGHRAGVAVRQPGAADRQGRSGSRTSRSHISDERAPDAPGLHVLPVELHPPSETRETRPARRAVPVGVPGRDRSRPARHVRRLHPGRRSGRSSSSTCGRASSPTAASASASRPPTKARTRARTARTRSNRPRNPTRRPRRDEADETL